MLKTVFPEEDADDPFASIIAKQPKIIDHNLKLEKGMKPKQKWNPHEALACEPGEFRSGFGVGLLVRS